MRLTKILAIAAAAGGAFACSDPGDPGQNNGDTTPITFETCATVGLGWFAYQNQGGPWTQVTPNSTGQITFEATDRVSLAMAFSFFGTSFTYIVNATATELQGAQGVSCESVFAGDRSMNGTVAGVTGEQVVRISAGPDSKDLADASDPSWLLEDLPNRALDVIATRYAQPFSQPGTHVLVRRNVTPANVAIGALDFGSNEAGALETATVALGGLGNGSVFASTTVITANGTEHELGDMSNSPPTGSSMSIGYVSVPASLRASTDMHVLEAATLDAVGTRTLQHYYRTPGAKSFTFGANVNAPTVTNAATTPYTQPRMQLGSQTEYPSGILAQFAQANGETSATVIGILTTAGFTGGTPATWTINVPDMTSANYNVTWGLQGTDYNWSVTAYSATNGAALVSETPADGTTILSATRGEVEFFGRRSVLGPRPSSSVNRSQPR